MNKGDFLFGGQLTIFIDGSAVAHSNSASLEITREEVNVSGMGAKDIWAKNIYGKRASWSGSFEGLVVREDSDEEGKKFDDLLDQMIEVGEPVEIAFIPQTIDGDDVSGLTYRYGDALINTLSEDIDGEANTPVTYSADFVGAGPLDSSTAD